VSFALKRDIARRMLKFPKTLEKSSLLTFTLQQLASHTVASRVLYYGTVPFGLLENGVLQIQDHCEMLFYLLKESGRLEHHVRHSKQAIDWERLMAEALSKVRVHHDSDPEPIGPEKGSEQFVTAEENAHEWADFALLLRELNELGARPLLLSMPIDGRYFDRFGVGRPFRDLYYKRVRQVAEAHNVPILDFEGHDLDEDFLAGHHDHLSDKGWLFFDKAIDNFFHDRVASQPRT